VISFSMIKKEISVLEFCILKIQILRDRGNVALFWGRINSPSTTPKLFGSLHPSKATLQ